MGTRHEQLLALQVHVVRGLFQQEGKLPGNTRAHLGCRRTRKCDDKQPICRSGVFRVREPFDHALHQNGRLAGNRPLRKPAGFPAVRGLRHSVPLSTFLPWGASFLISSRLWSDPCRQSPARDRPARVRKRRDTGTSHRLSARRRKKAPRQWSRAAVPPPFSRPSVLRGPEWCGNPAEKPHCFAAPVPRF